MCVHDVVMVMVQMSCEQSLSQGRVNMFKNYFINDWIGMDDRRHKITHACHTSMYTLSISELCCGGVSAADICVIRFVGNASVHI